VPAAKPSYVAFFFFDFKDASKQDIRALQSSLLIQLCAQSDRCFNPLFDLYDSHDRGKQQPSERALSECLKSMFGVLGQVPIYLIIDALDECPNISKSIGVLPSRQKILEFLKELVELRLPNLHICATSRYEFDIKVSLERLARFKVSLHDQDGQKQDIAKYIRSVVHSDKEPVMKQWRQEIKGLVIQTLSEQANGMYGCCSILTIHTHAITKVSMGSVPAGNPSRMPVTECSACAQQIAEIFRRNI
jgi:hypothetical protein